MTMLTQLLYVFKIVYAYILWLLMHKFTGRVLDWSGISFPKDIWGIFLVMVEWNGVYSFIFHALPMHAWHYRT